MDDHRTLLGVDDTDLIEVDSMVRANEHREPFVEPLDSDRVVEGVKNDVVSNAVPMGAGRDDRLMHQPMIVAAGGASKLTCGDRRAARPTSTREGRNSAVRVRLPSHPANCKAATTRGHPTKTAGVATERRAAGRR